MRRSEWRKKGPKISIFKYLIRNSNNLFLYQKSQIMFLYEAAEYLFDEMQSNNNYQFRNYLNLNIDNHFHNVLYSNNYYNHGPSSQQHQNLQGPTSTNHVSLTLLPNLQSHYQKRQQQQQNQTKNSNLQTQNTLTLPNNLNQAANLNKFNVPQHLRINETIGNRLHNSFQDAITTIPLNSVKISMDPQSQNKSSFIDLPRSMLPSFFDSKQPQQARRSTSANYRTSKAMKFMNTMRIKSVSFKRALFPNTNLSTNSQEKSPIPAAQTIQMQSHPRQSAVEQVEGTIRMETSTEFKVQAAQQHLDNEQKPSIIISLSSGSSSTTTSSSTALSSTPITTATESYKSSFVPANAVSVANRSSREKLG
jgi:hypothetical protein